MYSPCFFIKRLIFSAFLATSTPQSSCATSLYVTRGRRTIPVLQGGRGHKQPVPTRAASSHETLVVFVLLRAFFASSAPRGVVLGVSLAVQVQSGVFFSTFFQFSACTRELYPKKRNLTPHTCYNILLTDPTLMSIFHEKKGKFSLSDAL